MSNTQEEYLHFVAMFHNVHGLVPPPTYDEWLFNIHRNVWQPSSINHQQVFQVQPPSQGSITQVQINHAQQLVPPRFEKPAAKSNRRDRWSEAQTNMLVQKCQQFLGELESGLRNPVWVKVKLHVDSVGPEKTIQQCKDKFRNMKDAYKTAKDHNKKTGVAPIFPEHYHSFEEMFGHRDVVTLSNIKETGRKVTEASGNCSILQRTLKNV